MDTEQRLTPAELAAQHKKSMDEARQLEPAVMVTERNWNAMLKMQHDLFQQQMQLDANLKTLLTQEEAQESLIKMQTSAEKFEKQAGSLNERYSSGCKALTETLNDIRIIYRDIGLVDSAMQPDEQQPKILPPLSEVIPLPA